MPTGELNEDHAQVFREVGEWLEPYGEAVYNTRGGPYINQRWGGSTYRINGDGTETIYLHVSPLLNNYMPEGNSLQIDIPSNGQVYGSAELVKDGTEVTLVQNEEGYLVTLPEGMEWDEWDTVIQMNPDLGATLKNRIAEARDYAGTMTADDLSAAREALISAADTAENAAADGSEEQMSEQMRLLSEALARAQSAKALSDTILSVAEKLASVPVGTNPWECPQNLYDQLSAGIASGKELLADPASGKADFDSAASSMEIAVDSLDDIMDAQAIGFSPESGELQSGGTFTMTSPYEELQIRYTLDGSEPTTESSLYAGEALTMSGNALSVNAILVDGNNRQIGSVQNQTYLAAQQMANIAVEKNSAAASSIYSDQYTADKAADGSMSTRWATPDGTITATLELAFDKEYTVNAALIKEYVEGSERSRITSYAIEYWDKETGSWMQAYQGSEGGASKACMFDSVTSDRFRLNIPSCMNVTIYEFALFDTAGENVNDNLALGKNAEATTVYGSGFEAVKALDGNDKTRWASAIGSREQILTIDLGEEMEMNRAAFSVYADRSDPVNYEVYTDFKIQYEKDGQWIDAYDSSAGTHKIVYPVFNGTEQYGANGGPVWVDSDGVVKSTNYTVDFDTITAQKIRLYSNNTKKDPSIIEFELYNREETDPAPGLGENLALGQLAAASSIYNNSYPPELAVDGSDSSRWASAPGQSEYWLEVDFPAEMIFDTVNFKVYADAEDDELFGENPEVYQSFQIQYWNGESWVNAYDSSEQRHTVAYPDYSGSWIWDTNSSVYRGGDGTVKLTDYTVSFEPVSAARVRLYSNNTLKDPSLIEFGVYRMNAEEPSEPVSKNILERFLNMAKGYVEDGSVDSCVESVQKLFADAIAEGEAVMADENVTREEVINVAAKLMLAIQALDMKAGDKTDLEMAAELGDMIDLTKYVEAGQAEFVEALTKAKEVLADGDAFQDDIDSTWNALADAITDLRLKADKSVLQDLISQMAELDLTAYTEETVSVFRAALAAANDILEDEALSVDDQAKVDEAVSALQTAYDGLEKDQAEEPENPGSGDAEEPQNSGGDGGNQSGTGGNAGDEGCASGETGDAGQNGGAASGQNGSNGTGAAKAAKTGDTAPIMAAGMLLVFAAGTVLTVMRRRVRR